MRPIVHPKMLRPDVRMGSKCEKLNTSECSAAPPIADILAGIRLGFVEVKRCRFSIP